jgi:mannose-6-phosphate isomerase-like protein (cupin superfamily)
MRNITKFAAAALALLIIPAAAQESKVYTSWVPKKMVPYTAPNKPITRIDAVLAKHKGKKSWKEDVINTDRYHAQWIQMAPGEKTRTIFYADDRTVWIVWGGQVRFNIQGQEPFVATKGFMVQTPLRMRYSMEVVGNEPALFFEVRRNDTLPSYAFNEGEPVPATIGIQKYEKVSYPPNLRAGGNVPYDDVNKPYLDFFKDIVAKYPNGGSGWPRYFVNDKENQLAIIRGMGVPTPPPTNRGHFHINTDEFWFIPEGKIDYLMEGVGLITANAGDIVYATPGRYHRASFAAGQMDTRLAFNRSPTLQHNYAEDANGRQ